MAEQGTSPSRPGLVQALGEVTSRIAGRAVPDPFVIAVLLTVVTLLVTVAFGEALAGQSLIDRLVNVAVRGWYSELTSEGLLAFAFQMVTVLVTGHALALSPPVQRLIDKVARAPRSSAQASAVVALAACLTAYVHWGLGAVAGAMLAREIGRAWSRLGRPHHYPLLGAAAYSGLLVWHGGLSGTAPLKISEEGHFLVAVTGVVPTSATLFGALNIGVTVSLVLLSVALFYLLTPAPGAPCEPFDPDRHGGGGAHSEAGPDGRDQAPLVRLLERSAVVPALVMGLAAAAALYRFYERGDRALDLNLVNLSFFALGLALHGSPRSYVAAAAEGARGAVGIVLQFPLYFGVLGMLKAGGLIEQLSDVFVSISTEATLPLFIYLSAGLVNLFVPSGGGPWAVQGPVMMTAARSLGVDPAKAVMALAYGDAWTNMLQPFWALPLLGITGLRARDIIGYTTLLFLAACPLTMLWLFVL